MMASAILRLKQTAAALTPGQKLPFTIVLATPKGPTPKFLHQVQQSNLDPLFIGERAIFFRKAELSDWGWSHIFLLAGRDNVQLDPASFNLRQAWSFSIDANEGFVHDDEFEEDNSGGLGVMKANGDGGVEEPEDLAAQIKYWFRPTANRLWVLNFLNFAAAACDARERYEEHLAEMNKECGLKVHLFGDVTRMGELEGPHEPTTRQDPEKADAFALLSFPGEREYANFLLSEGHRRLIRGLENAAEGNVGEESQGGGVVEEGMILTKEMRLPPKEQAIHQLGWQYGNPYEPFGEDWFG